MHFILYFLEIKLQATVECVCLCFDESAKLQHECSCFMFRLKRNNLVKRLWKLRLSGHEATCKDEESLHILKSIAHSMLKKLSEDMLETLVKAIERKDTEPSGCVMVSADLLSQAKCAVLPHVLCCKLWRWTDLEMDQSLKQLSWCSDAGKLVVCCNPFHWSRLMSAGKPARERFPK